MNKLFQKLVSMGVKDAATANRMIQQYKQTGVL
jgi:hypothetical protein